MMSKPNVIEKAKNLSLVVLFLSTVLLLYFFWGNISFDSLKIKASYVQTAESVPVAASLLKPDRIVINFGSDNYTVIPPGDIWYNPSGKKSFVKELEKFGPADNILVKEITYDQYQQVEKFRSIWADFGYDVPFSDFCSTFNIDDSQSYDAIDTVTEIGYSSVDKGKSLFIKDGKNQKYYWLVAGSDSTKSGTSTGANFPALIDSIESGGYNIYYPLSSYLSGENNTLVPLSIKTDLRGLASRQELYPYQTEKINSFAEQFFGGNFDFVRKITEENGTIIYMYGYGQNVLIVNTDGSIEYKEEPTGGGTGGSFSDALEAAVGFVANHGSWESAGGAKLTPYLKSVIPDPNKQKGYRFVFGVEIDGDRLYYENGDPIVVDVISGQVTYYKRQLIDVDSKELSSAETLPSKDAFSAVNLIAKNYKYIYDILLQSGKVSPTADQAAMFENIAFLVNNMQVGFVKLTNPEITDIKPAWIVTVKDMNLYFDLYSADPLGYSAE